MKHKGKTPAIYATPKRAHLIQPGQAIPPRASFIIAHANLTFLAIAFDKSTNGNRDGTREPCNGGLRSYNQNAEAVLQRVLNAKAQSVTLREFQDLRHTLGSSHLQASQPDLGWRNYYALGGELKEDEPIKGLVERGLMEEFKPGYFRCTKAGMILAGMTEEQAEEASRG